MRKVIRDGNEEEIKKFLPDGIEVADFLLAMGKKAKEEPKPEPQPEMPPTAPVAERKYQNQDDMFADYVLFRETDVEDTAQAFNIPIPDIRYAFTVGNMVVMSDDMWDKLEIRVSAITPVKDVYDFVENNPEVTVYAAYGKGEESRYKNLSKYPNAKIGLVVAMTSLRESLENVANHMIIIRKSVDNMIII